MNLHLGVSNVRATNNFVRNSGDDGLAMWSESNPDGLVNHNNVYDHNTVQTPVLANDIAIYGGRDNAVTDNLVADPIREGSTLHAGSRFNATPFEGKLTFARNTTVRGGPRDLNWDIGLGAIWLYALQSTMSGTIEITDSSFLDSTYNAMMFVVDWPVKDDYAITNVAVRNIKVDGTGTNVVNARVGGWATFENVDARNVGAPFVNNCGTFHFDGPPEFDVGCCRQRRRLDRRDVVRGPPRRRTSTAAVTLELTAQQPASTSGLLHLDRGPGSRDLRRTPGHAERQREYDRADQDDGRRRPRPRCAWRG